jgi:HEPN domain-containing protein
MDEFSKTKISFTIALLAMVFAIKPVIDAYGNIGFLLFDFKITIQYAYFLTVIFLGIAVYFISLQLTKVKQLLPFDKISNLTYALSLSVPIIFIMLWILVIISTWLSQIIPSIPTNIWSPVASGMIGAISAILGQSVIKNIAGAIKKRDMADLQEYMQKKEFDFLSRAEKLAEDSNYDLSLLESYKIAEMALKQAIILRYGSVKSNRFNDLILQAHELNLLSKFDVERLKIIKTQRNMAAHSDHQVTKEQALNALSTVKHIIKLVSFTTNISGFNWLQVNRKEALRELTGENKNLIEKIISHLWDAWLHRDGAISGEISTFFEACLKSNPQPILEMFYKDKTQFELWLNQLSTQMFTDYIGGRKSNLEDLKADILINLKRYIKQAANKEYKDMATTIKDKIERITIREVD